MLKAYKYRLYPTTEQQKLLDQHFGCCRLVYNLALEVRIQAWQAANKYVSHTALQEQLVGLKKEYSWLYDVNAQGLQSKFLHLDNAYQKFFKGAGFPKFKKKSGYQSYQCPQNVKVNFDAGTIFIPKIKEVPAVISRAFEGQVKTCTVSRTATGKYFISVLVDNKKAAHAKPAIIPDTTIGIDVGIKSFVVTSDGRRFEPNRKLKENLRRLQCLQRRASRKKKGSKNYKKATKCVAILHEKITNQRTDYIQQTTTRLIRDNQTDSLVIENLCVAGMLKNEKLAQAISDVSFGKFFEVLKYKCREYGRNLIVIDRFAPSSKRCSCCGVINEALTLADREWTCAACGAEHDRDENASKNIKWYGLQQTIFKEPSPEGTVRGGPVESRRLRRARKQEVSKRN
jgi:putative transposase